MHLLLVLFFLIMAVLLITASRRNHIPASGGSDDPFWFDIRYFQEGLAILDDEEVRTLLDSCLRDGDLDAAMILRTGALVNHLRSAPNSLHSPAARRVALALAEALEMLLHALAGEKETLPAIREAVAAADAAYLTYRSFFYTLTGE